MALGSMGGQGGGQGGSGSQISSGTITAITTAVIAAALAAYLGISHTWTATQVLPHTAAQGNELITALNSADTGTVNAARVETGTSAGQIVALDGSAKLPAVDGSQLTNLTTDPLTVNTVQSNTGQSLALQARAPATGPGNSVTIDGGDMIAKDGVYDTGGGVIITTGDAVQGDAAAMGASGTLLLQTGTGAIAGGSGGVSITTGSSGIYSGAVAISTGSTGNPATAFSPGPITLLGGNGGGNGYGGGINLTGGTTGSLSGMGGSIHLNGGASSGNSNSHGGGIYLTSGASGAEGNAGPITIQGGSSNSVWGEAGHVNILGGNGSTTGATPGNINLTTGVNLLGTAGLINVRGDVVFSNQNGTGAAQWTTQPDQNLNIAEAGIGSLVIARATIIPRAVVGEAIAGITLQGTATYDPGNGPFDTPSPSTRFTATGWDGDSAELVEFDQYAQPEYVTNEGELVTLAKTPVHVTRIPVMSVGTTGSTAANPVVISKVHSGVGGYVAQAWISEVVAVGTSNVTTGNLLPASARILCVAWRILSEPLAGANITSFDLGPTGGTANLFADDAALDVGTASNSWTATAQGGYLAAALTPYQNGAANTITVTPNGGATWSSGIIRISVLYEVVVPPAN